MYFGGKQVRIVIGTLLFLLSFLSYDFRFLFFGLKVLALSDQIPIVVFLGIPRSQLIYFLNVVPIDCLLGMLFRVEESFIEKITRTYHYQFCGPQFYLDQKEHTYCQISLNHQGNIRWSRLLLNQPLLHQMIGLYSFETSEGAQIRFLRQQKQAIPAPKQTGSFILPSPYTYKIIIMQNTQKQQLLHLYHQLPPKITTPLHFLGGNIRNKDHNGQLQKPFMAFAAYVSAVATKYKHPFVIIVTASHNPPNENGLKLESLGPIEPFNVTEMEKVINDEGQFEAFVKRLDQSCRPSSIPIHFFVGRDCRPTSEGLTSILIQSIELMGNKVIDLGRTTTPEAISLGQYILESNNNQPQLETKQLTKQFYHNISLFWKKAIDIISKHRGREWKKKAIYIDCSNGVASISLQKYDFLNKYFNLNITHNEKFFQPNVNCGAEWIYNHRMVLEILPPFQQADHYLWFDGDADRIIMKLHNEKGLVVGEDFIVCFTKLIQNLLSAFPNALQVGWVSNIVANNGLAKHMRKQNISGQLSSVGIVNLFNTAKKYDICTFFESNGHGCIYFSPKALQILEKEKHEHWQAELMLMIYALCRNNCRGYALHDFLIFELYLFYTGNEVAFHFRKQFNLDKDYNIRYPENFLNSKQGDKMLITPAKLVEQIEIVSKKYQNITILMRKASTGPILRLSIQGQQVACQEILPLLEQIILNYTQ